MRKSCLLAALVVSLLLSLLLFASVAISEDPTERILLSVADSTVSSANPDSAAGGSSHLILSLPDDCAGARCGHEALLRFDLSALPSECTVLTATLQLDLLRGIDALPVRAYQVSEAWDEATVSWNSMPACSARYAEATIDPRMARQSWDVTAIVQDWVSGTATNHGLALRMASATTSPLTLAAREHAGTGADPRLLLMLDWPDPAHPTRPATGKPDLVIADIWPVDDDVCYQLRNVGDSLAPEGHVVALRVDGAVEATHSILASLAAGERISGCLALADPCAQGTMAVQVCADDTGVVDELLEDNNCRAETWPCQIEPPKIISGPIVSLLDATRARVLWETDRPCDASVSFGRSSRMPDRDQSLAAYASRHDILLDNLSPGAAYHYCVTSTDRGGLTTEAACGLFFAETLPDDVAPIVQPPAPGPRQGQVALLAQAQDDGIVERIAFYLDGGLLGIDYAPPHAWLVDTTRYGNGDHEVQVMAYDQAGNMTSETAVLAFENPVVDMLDPTVTITTPSEGEDVGNGLVSIEVHAHDTDPNLFGSAPVARVYVYIDDQLRANLNGGPGVFTFEYTWNTMTAGAFDTTHVIRAVAVDGSGNEGEDTVSAMVPGPQAAEMQVGLRVTRLPLERDGANYRTGLFLENTGFGRISNIRVSDWLSGFQARTGGVTPVTVSLNRYNKDVEVEMGGELDLEPGESEELSYYMVPMLLQGGADYEIGWRTFVGYWDAGGTYHTEELTIPEADDLEVDEALSHVNYVVVSHPGRLFGYYAGNEDDVNNLTVAMAKLAANRAGCVAYLEDYSAQALLHLVSPGGEWSDQLHPDWELGSGNLVIVGETEIVPARMQEGVRSTDNYFADTSGGDYRPELVVGRMIGNGAHDLSEPIAWALSGTFDDSSALCVSGTGDGMETFQENIDQVADLLDDSMSVDVIHFGDEGGIPACQSLFRSHAQDVSLIVLRDHGSETSFDHGTLINSELPSDFGAANPFVWASACLTGHYHGFNSLAEGFLDNGAAVYVGSTEVSMRYTNNYANLEYFEYWTQNHVSSGRALKNLKRHLIDINGANDFEQLWVLEYNLYGDPNYAAGGSALSASRGAEMAPSLPPMPWVIDVPAYQVSQAAGYDVVTISGGVPIVAEGQPLLPGYLAQWLLPENTRVQDVELLSRSEPVVEPGLELEVVEPVYDGATPAPPEGFYPGLDMDWQAVEQSDGTTMLTVRLYPFQYNALTGAGLFYGRYTLAVETTSSPVALTDVRTDRLRYPEGATMRAMMAIENSGPPQDVVCEAVIRRGVDEIVAGLLLEQLQALEGQATFDPRWSSDGHPAGDYVLEVRLLDAAGQLLDAATSPFTLGIGSAQMVALSATPEYLTPGETVALTWVLSNTGTVAISGTAHIDVLDSLGAMVTAFARDLPSLPPGELAHIEEQWDTIGLQQGVYSLRGYMSWPHGATEPRYAVVSTSPSEAHLYLPVVKTPVRNE